MSSKRKVISRKILVRILAVIFMLIGLWNVGIFFSPIFLTSGEKMLNFAYLLSGFILFRTGDNLYQLKEFGRKIAIILLFIHAAQIVFIIVAYLFYTPNDYALRLRLFGQSVVEIENKFLGALLLFPWLSLILGAIVILLQKGTRELIQNIYRIPPSDETTKIILNGP